MKSSEIKVFGRAAMVGRQLSGAAIPVLFCSGALVWGFMTANVRLLLSAGEIEGALLGLGSEFAPIINIAVCLLLAVAGLFLFAPASVGVYEWFLRGAMNDKIPIKRVFSWYSYKKAFRAFALTLTLLLIKSGIVLLFCLPGLALAAGGIYMLFSSGISLGTALTVFSGSAVLLAVGAVFSFCTVQRYAAAPYIAAIRPCTGVRSAINASARIMQGRYLSCAAFKLSFAPWLLSCLLVVPALFVWPYYRQACAVWILETVRNLKNNIDRYKTLY